MKKIIIESEERCHYVKLPQFEEPVNIEEPIEVEDSAVEEIKELGKRAGFKVKMAK